METIGNAKTTIAIGKETKKKLAAFANKGQTYDEILKILISSWNESR